MASERDPRFQYEKRTTAARLYRRGLTERQVADEMRVSRTVARRYLDDAGVERRRRGAPRSSETTGS